MTTDFDFLIGSWNVFNTRLTKLFCECPNWVEFESQHIEKKLSNSKGNVAFHHYVLNNVLHERSVIRSYNKTMDFWKIDRLDGMSNLLMAPLQGTFWSNKGSFISKGLFDDTEVWISVEWTKICKTYACWEQALSKDGKTWEANWIMEFYKKL